MKSHITLALTMLLIEGTVGTQPGIAGSEREPWIAAIQSAATLSRMGEYRQALARYQALLSTTSAVTANVEIHVYVLTQMADANIELGDYLEAEAQAREAMGILTGARKTHISTFAVVEGVLANALGAEGDYDTARQIAEQAVALGKETLDPAGPRFGTLLTTLSLTLENDRKPRRALPLCRRAVDILEKAGEAYKIDLGTAYQNLAVVYILCGKPSKALEAVNAALDTWKQALPPNHPFVVYALCTKLAIYTKLKAFPQAEEIVPGLLESGVSRFGLNHPERVFLLDNAAALYVAEKNYPRAESFLREGIDLSKRVFPPGHPLARNMLENYAYVLERLNRKEEASRVRAESEVLLAFPRAPHDLAHK